MNALTLLGFFLATIIAVLCGPHSKNHHLIHRENKNVGARIPDSLALPQVIKAQRLRVPEKVRQHMAEINKKEKMDLEMPEKLKRHIKERAEEMRLSKDASSGASTTVPLDDYYGYYLVANITMGTPPQNLRVLFSVYDQDLYVAGAGSKEQDSSESYSYETSSSTSSSISSSSSSEVADIVRGSANTTDPTKNTYNDSASSTSTRQNAFFVGNRDDIRGSLVNDFVNLGGLNLNITFGDVSVYDWWFDYIPADGVFGLAPSPSINGIPNVLQQIAGQLDKPIVVLHTYRSYESYVYNTQDDSSEVNEIAFGTESVSGCGSDWTWHPVGANPTRWATVNSSSASIEVGADGCASELNVTHRVFLRNYFNTMYCSYQLMDMLVVASGAQYNSTSWEYEVPCDQVSQGRNVILGLESGGSITLAPNDYISEVKGTCFLNAQGWYDERDPGNNNYGLVLGQQFLNNHCVGYNVADNTLGISNIPTPSV